MDFLQSQYEFVYDHFHKIDIEILSYVNFFSQAQSIYKSPVPIRQPYTFYRPLLGHFSLFLQRFHSNSAQTQLLISNLPLLCFMNFIKVRSVVIVHGSQIAPKHIGWSTSFVMHNNVRRIEMTSKWHRFTISVTLYPLHGFLAFTKILTSKLAFLWIRLLVAPPPGVNFCEFPYLNLKFYWILNLLKQLLKPKEFCNDWFLRWSDLLAMKLWYPIYSIALWNQQ